MAIESNLDKSLPQEGDIVIHDEGLGGYGLVVGRVVSSEKGRVIVVSSHTGGISAEAVSAVQVRVLISDSDVTAKGKNK